MGKLQMKTLENAQVCLMRTLFKWQNIIVDDAHGREKAQV